MLDVIDMISFHRHIFQMDPSWPPTRRGSETIIIMVLTLGTVVSTIELPMIEIAIIVMADLAKYLAGIGCKTTHSLCHHASA